MFTRAIVRKPASTFAEGLTTAELGKPDLDRAREQHAAYAEELRRRGLDVTVLEADDRFPDSTFVEDAAVVTARGAVIARPGAPTRRGETRAVAAALKKLCEPIARIQSPGTVDGGDVMQVEDQFYVGLSARTNKSGARQLLNILREWGYGGEMVPMAEMLHLKTGVAYLGGGWLLLTGELIKASAFRRFDIIAVPAGEAYAANCIRVNDRVLIPQGFPLTRNAVERAGFDTVALDVSEFRKMDGGLSCLSLRF